MRLKGGQTPEDVRALLGDPQWDSDRDTPVGEHFRHLVGVPNGFEVDRLFDYSQGSGSPHLGLRKEFSLEFFKNRLVYPCAYQMYDELVDKREGPFGMQLVSVDKSLPETYHLGEGFAALFHCQAGFSLADARARFGK